MNERCRDLGSRDTFCVKILLRFPHLRVASTDAAGKSRGRLRTMPSREEETPPLWWGKIAYIIQFSRSEKSNECRVFVALITRFLETIPKL